MRYQGTHCGGVNKDIVCHHCDKRGHMNQVCKSKDKQRTFRPKRKLKTVGKLQDEEKEEDQGPEDPILPRNVNISAFRMSVVRPTLEYGS